MPYLGSTVFVSVLVVVCLLSLSGSWLLVRSLAPAFHHRAERACSDHLGLTTLLGLVLASGSVLVVGAFLAGPGVAKAIGVILGTIMVGAATAGSSGLATRVGMGLASHDDEGRAWRQTLRGAMVLCASFVTPVLGWFVLLPLAIAAGLGAAFTSVAAGIAERVARPAHRRAT